MTSDLSPWQRLIEWKQGFPNVSSCRQLRRALLSLLIGASTFTGATCLSIQDGATPSVSAEPMVWVSLSDQLPQRVANAAKASVSQLRVADLPNLESTRADANEAIAQLKTYLNSTTTAENAAAWLEYLKADELQKALAEESRSAVIRAASDVQRRSSALHDGLERAAVVQFRTAAGNVADAYRFEKGEQVIQLFGKQLERLSDQWTTIEGEPHPDDIANLRNTVDMLHRGGQQVELLDVVAREFGHSNLKLWISEDLIAASVGRPLDLEQDVRECILGTRIIGKAQIEGSVSAELVPSDESIAIKVMMDGNVTARTMGFNGPVRLRASSNSVVHAEQVLQLNQQGLAMGQVSTEATSNNKIHSIEHSLRFVREIAKRKARQQKPQTDRIALARLKKRVGETFEEQVQQEFGATDPLQLVNGFINRLNLSQPKAEFSSTEDAAMASVVLAKPQQLASESAPKEIAEPGHVLVQVHESLVANSLGSLLAGRSLSRSEIQELIERIAQRTTESSEDEAPNFEVDFDSRRPVVFQCRDGVLRIGIRGTRFKQGSRELKRPLEIFAEYQATKQADGSIILARVGELNVNFPGTDRLSVTQAGLRGAMKESFAKAFAPTLMHKPWVVPEDAKLESLAGRRFVPIAFDADNGWLTLAIRLADQ
ncbi:MAG: hypothetical protein CBB71_08040 [Rhodopirellula sp. TMED11]|nr:MAG: hypothetical protein CBB71_08040 [Rhodopirellula sp. TMED11]